MKTFLHRPTHDALTLAVFKREIPYDTFRVAIDAHQGEVDELRAALKDALNAAAYYARIAGFSAYHLRDAAQVLDKYTPVEETDRAPEFDID